jgi:hypothetical protein
VPDSIDAVFAGPELAFAGVATLGVPSDGPVDPAASMPEQVPEQVADPVREGLERDLMQCATALTNDIAVARIVTDLALARMDQDAADQQSSGLGAEPPGQVTLFRMVRQAYHSIERTRVRRAPRPSASVAQA